MRPVVGITLGDGDRPGYHGMREDYARSVERSGAIPLVLPSQRPEDARGRARPARRAAALRRDRRRPRALRPRAPHPKLGRVDRRRDDFELALTREALARDLPILAICRGHQVLNVATGGTLVQDIPSELKGAVTHDAPGRRTRRAHAVDVVPASRLGEILGGGTIPVNSFHHQAIDELGKGLVVSARCPKDGLIEGVEMPGRGLRARRPVAPRVVLERDGLVPVPVRRPRGRVSSRLAGEVALTMASPLALALLLAGSAGERPAPPTVAIKWERKFDEALREAKRSGKPVVVDFWAEWCGWCHRLDRTTYADPAVIRTRPGFRGRQGQHRGLAPRARGVRPSTAWASGCR